MTARKVGLRGLTHTALAIVAATTAVPIFVIWMMSFKTNQEIFDNVLAIPRQWHVENLAYVWVQGNFRTYFVNSAIVAVPTVLLVIGCSALAAYALVFSVLKRKDLLFYLFLAGFMVPTQALIIPLFYNLAALRLMNTFQGLVATEAAVGIPFGIFLLRSFFRDIPRELVESARIDGAREYTILARIILPLGKSGVLTLAVLQFLWSWNELLLALIVLQQTHIQTITLGLLRLQGGKYTLAYNAIAGGVLITSVPIVIVFVLFQRRFIQGLTSSALKG